MRCSEIHSRIEENLKKAGISDADVRVQPDLYGGIHIAVVTDQFKPFSREKRQQTVLDGIDAPIEWLDLLTEEERKWAGSLPARGHEEELPLWPEALDRVRTEPDHLTLFPSDLDEDLPRPIVATFYSLRGGVGRSTALAYTGTLLSRAGHKVVCVDMDLEAPGLASLFGVENSVQPAQGVARLLVSIDQGEQPDFANHLLKLDEATELYLLPAGIAGPEYARLLRFIDPGAWYQEERNPLRIMLEGLEQQLPFQPDVILMDARTGITPLSGPLLFDIADIAVITFFPHPQAKIGTRALVQGLLRAETRRRLEHRRLSPEPRFIISPIPASKAREITERYEHRALDWITEWLEETNSRRESGTTHDNLEPLLGPDITHFVRYREDLATADRIMTGDPDIDPVFRPIAEWIERFIPTRDERKVSSLGPSKQNMLEELTFSTGLAEDQEVFSDVFVITETIQRSFDREIPLVLGRKGTGKTAIFRHLLESTEKRCVPIMAPSAFRRRRPWLLDIEGLRAADATIQQSQLSWRNLWMFLLCLALQEALGSQNAVTPPPELSSAIPERLESNLQLLEVFRTIASVPSCGVLLSDWLSRWDTELKDEIVLLFDGLDTGFGTTGDDRARRKTALEGLFELWIDRGVAFDNLGFKIVLREDIWKKLQFENKSHLFGRSVKLQWDNQAEYFKVVLKQAMLSSSFSCQVKQTRIGDRMMAADIDHWTTDEVRFCWNLLVGERMRGGKTAFTRNWVWNRLADGNDDHSPRSLLQLFHAGLQWEKTEEKKAPYDRSVIRPRAFSSCLPTVSEQALDALHREEFPELVPLINRLRNIGRTPIPANELDGLAEEVSLAREVGLLAVYEGTEEDVVRFKVPDFYRHGLGMTRKGQV